MQQIIIVGRGGQGAQVAGNQLAQAFFAEGRYVQSFATYGGARRGGPVASSIRVDDRPVQLRCNIERADAVLCFDSSLLEPNFLKVADRDTRIVVNTAKPRRSSLRSATTGSSRSTAAGSRSSSAWARS